MDDGFDIQVEMEQHVCMYIHVSCTSSDKYLARSRGGCLSVTGFLALVSGGQRLSSVGGVCHDLEMMVIYDMLSPTPDVATGTSLSPWLSQKQDTVSGWNVALQSQASTVSEAHLFPYLYLAVSLLTH